MELPHDWWVETNDNGTSNLCDTVVRDHISCVITLHL